ncbi:hypothetical protein WA158_006237 [Blastocystis sp. Blastoise]
MNPDIFADNYSAPEMFENSTSQCTVHELSLYRNKPYNLSPKEVLAKKMYNDFGYAFNKEDYHKGKNVKNVKGDLYDVLYLQMQNCAPTKRQFDTTRYADPSSIEVSFNQYRMRTPLPNWPGTPQNPKACECGNINTIKTHTF